MDKKSPAQSVHRPIAQGFSPIKILDISFLPVNRQLMLAMTPIIPEVETLHMQGAQFKTWEKAFVEKITSGQFASLRLLNVMQSNLSENSLLQILKAVQENRLPHLKKLGMDLSYLAVAQRYRHFLLEGRYQPLNEQSRPRYGIAINVPTVQLDLQDARHTTETILRVLLNYLNPGLLQSVVDIQLAGKKLDRPVIALLSTFPALKVLNISGSYHDSCRAYALFSHLTKQRAWAVVDIQTTGSTFAK